MFPSTRASDDETRLLWETNRQDPVPPLGRVLSTLFAAESRKIEKILSSDTLQSQQGSVGRAVAALLHHVEKGLRSGTLLDQISVPLLEHVVKSKDQSNRRKVFALMHWLLKKREVGGALAKSWAAIAATSQWDHRVKLGLCLVVRELVEKGSLFSEASSVGQIDEELSHPSPAFMSFVACVPPLVQIVCSASVKEGKPRAPTRLTIAAADCVLVITKYLATGRPSEYKRVKKLSKGSGHQEDKPLITPTGSSSFEPDQSRAFTNIVSHTSEDEDGTSTSGSQPQVGYERALWDNLDHVILLVTELYEWNEEGRPLHARGLQQALMRLRLLTNFRDSLQAQGGGESDVAVGVAVLAACWRHYSSLMLVEDHTLSSNPQPIIEHWLGGLQYWMREAQEMGPTVSRRADEMRGYALTCLALVLGRLEPRRLDTALEGFEAQLLQALLDELRVGDNENVDLAVAVLRALLFRPMTTALQANSIVPPMSSRIEEIVPMLMDMLDARDSTARAVVLLVAEFFAENPESPELEKLFARLDSNQSVQRRNALDVLTELLSLSTRSMYTVDSTLSCTIAKHLFARLGDEELTNRMEASSLFAKLAPVFTLPALVRLIYSSDTRVRSAASSAVGAVLKGHSDQGHTITVLLDCIRDMVEGKIHVPENVDQSGPKVSASGPTKSGAPVDVDRVLRLVPDWASMVQDWEPLVGLLLDKMYAEASNPVIPRFFSHISSQLSDMAHLVLPHVLQRMDKQALMTEDLLLKLREDEDELSRELFQRLSPMLVLRVLPLKAFDDTECLELYNGLLGNTQSFLGLAKNNTEVQLWSTDIIEISDRSKCITTLLIERMCGLSEFEDVRKVAAELSGRLLPNAMLPLVTRQLERATTTTDVLMVKACLFALCTSLLMRGKESLDHPLMGRVRQSLSQILLWPGVSVEIGKAQHGCIDCFAAMICAELGGTRTAAAPPSSLYECQRPVKLIEEVSETQQKGHSSKGEGQRQANMQRTVLASVIDCLTGQQRGIPFLPRPKVDTLDRHRNNEESSGQRSDEDGEGGASPTAFRVCMANVLISASQKISSNARPSFAKTMIPSLLAYAQAYSLDKSLVKYSLFSEQVMDHAPSGSTKLSGCLNRLQEWCTNSRAGLEITMSIPALTAAIPRPVGGESILRVSCLQVLFTAVYHLKGIAVLPYAFDLFSLSIATVRGRGSAEERIAGAKLLASLLASEDGLVDEIAPYLTDACTAVAGVANMDASLELRTLCEQLLACMTTARDTS